jgi:hypothetical protein
MLFTSGRDGFGSYIQFIILVILASTQQHFAVDVVRDMQFLFQTIIVKPLSDSTDFLQSGKCDYQAGSASLNLKFWESAKPTENVKSCIKEMS